jgi:hypothetical protein
MTTPHDIKLLYYDTACRKFLSESLVTVTGHGHGVFILATSSKENEQGDFLHPV